MINGLTIGDLAMSEKHSRFETIEIDTGDTKNAVTKPTIETAISAWCYVCGCRHLNSIISKQ